MNTSFCVLPHEPTECIIMYNWGVVLLVSLACLAADTAGSEQAEISSLALHCYGLDRKQESCLSGHGLWNKGVLQEKKTETKTKHQFLHCTMQICQVSESPCLPHLTKRNINILFLLCSFSSSCPSFHFYPPPPSIFYPKVHFRNSSPGSKVNILDFSHQSFQYVTTTTLPRVLKHCISSLQQPSIAAFVMCPEIHFYLLYRDGIH